MTIWKVPCVPHILLMEQADITTVPRGSKSPVTPVFLLPCQWACSILLVNDKCTCCANLALFDGDWVVFKGVWEFHDFQFILFLSPFFTLTSLLHVKIGFRSKTVFCYVIAQRFVIPLIMSIYVFTTYILSVTARKSWIYVYLLIYMYIAYNSD